MTTGGRLPKQPKGGSDKGHPPWMGICISNWKNGMRTAAAAGQLTITCQHSQWCFLTSYLTTPPRHQQVSSIACLGTLWKRQQIWCHHLMHGQFKVLHRMRMGKREEKISLILKHLQHQQQRRLSASPEILPKYSAANTYPNLPNLTYICQSGYIPNLI
jgi:hypothetical protein